jgi:hypothetical protein
VVTALITALTAYFALQQGNGESRTATPIFLTVVMIVLGSGIGVYGRTHNWLGFDREAEAKNWSLRTGLSEQDVYRKMFDHEYSVAASAVPDTKQGVLFDTSLPKDECVQLRPARGEDLRRLLGAMKEQYISDLAQKFPAIELEYLVDNILCRKQ